MDTKADWLAVPKAFLVCRHWPVNQLNGKIINLIFCSERDPADAPLGPYKLLIRPIHS